MILNKNNIKLWVLVLLIWFAIFIWVPFAKNFCIANLFKILVREIRF